MDGWMDNNEVEKCIILFNMSKAQKHLFIEVFCRSPYLTVFGLKMRCSCWSGLSACSASSNNLEMTSRAGLCSEDEHTGVFTS